MKGISNLDFNLAVSDLGLKVIFTPNASNNIDASRYLVPNSSLNLFEKSIDFPPIIIRFSSKLMVYWFFSLPIKPTKLLSSGTHLNSKDVKSLSTFK